MKLPIMELDRLMNEEEKKALIKVAIGRLFKIMSRPHQPGDDEAYEECRSLIMNNSPPPEDNHPNWAVQRHGAVMRGDD